MPNLQDIVIGKSLGSGKMIQSIKKVYGTTVVFRVSQGTQDRVPNFKVFLILDRREQSTCRKSSNTWPALSQPPRGRKGRRAALSGKIAGELAEGNFLSWALKSNK